MHIIQGHQTDMAVYFRYIVQNDLSILCVQSSVHWTSHFLHGTRNTRTCLSGRVLSTIHCTLATYSLFSRIENPQHSGKKSSKAIIIINFVNVQKCCLFIRRSEWHHRKSISSTIRQTTGKFLPRKILGWMEGCDVTFGLRIVLSRYR